MEWAADSILIECYSRSKWEPDESQNACMPASLVLCAISISCYRRKSGTAAHNARDRLCALIGG